MEEWSKKIASAANSPLPMEKVFAYIDLLARRGYLVETPPPFSLDGKICLTQKFIETLEKAFTLLSPNLTEEETLPALSLAFSLLCLGENDSIEPEKVDPTEAGELAKVIRGLFLIIESKAQKGNNPSPPPFHLPPLSCLRIPLWKGEGPEVPRCSICTRKMRLSRRLNAYVCKNQRCPAYWRLGNGPILRITERGLVPGYSWGYRIKEEESNHREPFKYFSFQPRIYPH